MKQTFHKDERAGERAFSPAPSDFWSLTEDIYRSGSHMSEPLHEQLTRRERQIVDAVYALGEATVKEVVEYLGEQEAYDSIRVILAKLGKEGLLARERVGRKYVYEPAIPRERARKPAMSHLLETFFSGSSSRAILAFLDMSRDELSQEELNRITSWIEKQSEEENE